MFADLQKQAEKFMDEISDLCDQRYKEICADSHGSDLMALPSWPQAVGDSSQQSALDSRNPSYMATLSDIPVLALPTRQDHDQVLQNCLGQGLADDDPGITCFHKFDSLGWKFGVCWFF